MTNFDNEILEDISLICYLIFDFLNSSIHKGSKLSKKNSLSEVTFSRYSLALYELAHESDSVNEVEKQALTIVDLISKSEDLKFCIKSPTISKKELENLINSISEKTNMNELLKKFLFFLIHKRRFFYVDKILREFIETCSKKRGEIKAELISAKDLSESDVENIKNDLSGSFNSKIKLTYKNDKSLVGGLILQVGSTMIDTSIKNKLQKIEKQMVEA